MKILICILIAGFSAVTQAKDMTSRLGVGYKEASALGLSTLAVSYFPNSDYAMLGYLGVDTKDQNSSSVFGVSLRRVIFKENQLNFFVGGAGMVLSQEVSGESSSGFEADAIAGAEFFLTGLENVGFSFEAGFGVINLKKTRFRTFGDSPLKAGMFFYF